MVAASEYTIYLAVYIYKLMESYIFEILRWEDYTSLKLKSNIYHRYTSWKINL